MHTPLPPANIQPHSPMPARIVLVHGRAARGLGLAHPRSVSFPLKAPRVLHHNHRSPFRRNSMAARRISNSGVHRDSRGDNRQGPPTWTGIFSSPSAKTSGPPRHPSSPMAGGGEFRARSGQISEGALR